MQTALTFSSPVMTGGNYISDWYGPLEQGVNMQKTAFGRFWMRTLMLRGNQAFVEDWLHGGLGRHVRMYDTGLSVVWEGFVNSMTGSVGSRSITVGPLLGGTANRLKVVYSFIDVTSNEPVLGGRESTEWADHAASQAKYGVIERVMSISGSTDTIASQLRDVVLDEIAWPRSVESDSWGSATDPAITLECLGYIHWLDAYVYNSTATGGVNASVKIENVLAADPNGIFSTNYSQVGSNTTPVAQWEDEDRTAMTIIKGIVAHGDPSLNRWVFYLKPERQVVYQAAPLLPRYQRSLKDPDQALRIYGGQGRVQPWQAEPGQWTFYTDFMITESASALSQDLRYTFLEQVNLQMPWNLSLQGNIDQKANRLLAQLGLGGTV